jgi:triacylglycerol lipase
MMSFAFTGNSGQLAVCRPVTLAWLAICVGIGVSRAAEPEPVRETATAAETAGSVDVKVITNERFSDCDGKAGLCDVYCPTTRPPKEGHPAVVVVHGGGWISGDKWTLENYSRYLAKHGFVAVTINYRLAPTHKFPAQVDDVRSALIWTSRNADRFDIDVNRLGMFGYSAGGHLSALVASLADESIEVRSAASQWEPSDPRWTQLPPIRAVCAGGPPCDFRSLQPDNSMLAYFLGGSRREKPQVYVAASPAAHVSPGDPVTQLIHGESDLIVPVSESRQFHQLQRDAGIDSRFELMPKQGHMITFLNPKTSQKMLEFFQEVLAIPDQARPEK